MLPPPAVPPAAGGLGGLGFSPNTNALIRLRLSFASRSANNNQKYEVTTFPNTRRSSVVSVLASSRASKASPSSRLSWTSSGCFLAVPSRQVASPHGQWETRRTGRCITETVLGLKASSLPQCLPSHVPGISKMKQLDESQTRSPEGYTLSNIAGFCVVYGCKKSRKRPCPLTWSGTSASTLMCGV